MQNAFFIIIFIKMLLAILLQRSSKA